MATPLLDSDLDELTHLVADRLDEFSDIEVDRQELNDRLEEIIIEFGIQREEK